MSEVMFAIYSHADGPRKGWFGRATHPAHLDGEGQLVASTAWTISRNVPNDRPYDLLTLMRRVSRAKLRTTEGHTATPNAQREGHKG